MSLKIYCLSKIILKRQRHIKIQRSFLSTKFCVSRTGKIILNQNGPVMFLEASQILLTL
jgi:hypothetical protein